MIIQIFDYPSGAAFIDNFKRGDITDCKSYEYEKHFDAPGTFTAEIPATSIFVGAIKINSILIVDNQDFLIVKNIKETHDNVTVTGYDLKGLLVDRRTLYGAETVNGVEGYDAIKDVSTETILHHYIENNAVAPDDEKRIIPALHLAEDKERGIESDRYMARLENLSELVTTLCKNASIGYDITVTSGNLKPFEFNVLEMVDKTDSQSERNRVVFAIDRKNVATIEREVGVTADKNAFYIEAADTVTLQYHTEDEPAGIDRREEFLQLNCELDEVEIYTAKETEDYGKTDSLTVTAGDPQNYGAIYKLGDIVTVKYRGAILDSPIVSVLKKWSGTEYSIEITLGNSKPKLLDGFATKAEQNSKVQRNKAAGGGAKVTNNYLTAINQSAVALTSEYKTVAELSFEAASTTNALIPVIIQPDSNVQVSSRLRLGLTTISERQYVNGYTEILPNLSATQQTLYLDCKSDTAAVLPTGKTQIGLIAENVNLWVDTTIVTCEYYFDTAGTYTLMGVSYSPTYEWIDYGDGSDLGTAETHYYEAGTYIVKFKNLAESNGYAFQRVKALRRIVSGQLTPGQYARLQRMFDNSGLTNINGDFFSKFANATSAHSVFQSSDILALPSGLLSNAPLLSDARYFCYGCKNLTAIPLDFFDRNPLITDFRQAFEGCTNITAPVPKLWETHPAANGIACFRGCTSAANYADIPSGWK